MPDTLQVIIQTFVALFIVIDAPGNVPFVVSLSEGMAPREKRSVVNVAVLTATVVGLVFLFFGKFVLTVMGISVPAFSIAGGVILIVLAIRYMTTGHLTEVIRGSAVAVVPIGTPLTVGPGTITTLLLLVAEHQWYIVLLSFMLNMLLTWGFFLAGDQIVRFMGRGGLKALSQVFSLLLGAIGVNMIFRGLTLFGILRTS